MIDMLGIWEGVTLGEGFCELVTELVVVWDGVPVLADWDCV